MRIIYLLTVVSLVFFSCSEKKAEEKKKEILQGVITYEIKYLQTEDENSLISLLPVEMIYKFKDNSICQKIEGWGGVFTMMGIVNYPKKTNSALLKVMGKKYHFETSLESNEAFGFDEFPGMKIEYIEGETKEIAGYKCKKAIAYINDTIPPIELFYTEDLPIENPNRNNPFREIKGVLMSYQMSFQRIPMVMNAVKVEMKNIDDVEFLVPDDFEKVSKEDLQEFINTLI
ncbi:MAG: hypothetical protein A2W91_01950 [Bacteroidetes bacterium GWF2_38_335]|nr:MAG: hypothetical protein A2W91_01950 [Bacteroidetes bacterium GWF2_38_335]OFY80616.1 MAG: hypothetical protein A2281_04965 [Bacteroidetes bacterium RIFOXYA12_FULL_38_20]HBS86956.1 hypothetical protein [Bacteroidales bacterium]